MGSPDGFLQILQGQMGVNLGAGQGRVAQDSLDVAEIGLVPEHVRGHGVAKGVGGDPFLDPGPPRRLGDEITHGGGT